MREGGGGLVSELGGGNGERGRMMWGWAMDGEAVGMG